QSSCAIVTRVKLILRYLVILTNRDFIMLCKRCCGTGCLLIVTKDGPPVSKSFKVCKKCGGKGTSHIPFGPKEIHIGKEQQRFMVVLDEEGKVVSNRKNRR